jgi:hypothetical protein
MAKDIECLDPHVVYVGVIVGAVFQPALLIEADSTGCHFL